MIGVAEGHGGADFVNGARRRHLVGVLHPRTDQPVTLVDDRVWLATGYQQAREVMRDKRFSRAAAGTGCPRGPALRMSITELDPPTHTAIRTLVGGSFSARQVERLRPRVDDLADRLLARLVDSGRTVDLVADFCAPLTFHSQCALLGVPEHCRAAIRRRSDQRIGLPGATAADTYSAELLLHDEVVRMIADRDRPPGGLIATLIAGHLDESALTGLVASLFFDGHLLSAAQIANTVLLVLTHGLVDRLRTDPALLDDVIEETFRYCPSVNLSMPRVATAEVSLGDVQVRAGDRVAAAITLADRDHAMFATPDRFVPGRPTRHLAFGYGTHHCIGAHLARVQVRAAMLALLRRTPNLALATPEQELAWVVSPTVRRLCRLPVRFR
ncbi:cytochrome P450 [Actinocrispum wychmicini]|uniref:Cytochrome P450 n=1 Tax=Actinocrispum wychmicini TaxID=1213861 RepID=A0A4R2ITF0_9PSEU|nr:cytochrome P450 [Actinocrispum wychmicini]TCO47418.1 cytochrome P450 [Actinocrispum wychmicini]